MSNITLSAGVRANLLQLQQTSNLITQTENDLATGKKVNSALDNAISFFTAQGLDTRANNLSSLLDTMSNCCQHDPSRQQRHHRHHQAGPVSAIPGQPGATEHRHCHASHPGHAIRQPADPDRTARRRLGFQRRQPTCGNTLTVTLDETGNSTTSVTGVDYTNASGSALNIAAATNNWASSSDISAASTDLSKALTALNAESQTLSSGLSTVQIRQDFTNAMINTLQTGSDNLTLADSNQEGANLLALQTRQQLSTTALSLASQSDQNVLRLFQS